MSDARPTEEETDLREAAVRGVRWVALSRPIIEVLLLASMVVMARLISPAEFGHFAVAIAVSELAILIPSQGVGAALVQRAEVTRKHLQAGMALSILAGVGLALIVFVLAGLLVEPIFGERTAFLVRLVTPGFVLAGLTAVPLAVLTRELQFRLLSLLDVINTTVRAVASLALALAGLEADSMIYGGLIAGALSLVIVWVRAPAPGPWLHRRESQELLEYGAPAALAGMSWVGFRNCDYAIVGARLGAVQAGLYFRAYTLAVEYQKKISLVMGQVGFPVLARAASPEEMDGLRSQMARLLTVTMFPLLALLAILAPSVIPWVFGEPWRDAVVPTQVLAVGGAATLAIDAVGAVLMATSRARAMLGYGWAHFAVYAGAVLVVAPLGLTAVATAAAVVHVAFLVAAYWLMLRGTGRSTLRCLWGDVGPATTACLGLAAVGIPLAMALSAAGAPAPVMLVVVSGAGGLAYLVTLRVLHPRTWRGLLTFVVRVVPVDRLRAAARRAVTLRARPVGAER